MSSRTARFCGLSWAVLAALPVAFIVCSVQPPVPAVARLGDAAWIDRLRAMPDYREQVRRVSVANREADAADATNRAWLGTPFDPEAARGRVVATLGDRVALAVDPHFAIPEQGLLVAVYDESGFKVCVCCVEILAGHALGLVAFAKPGASPASGDAFAARTRRALWPSN